MPRGVGPQQVVDIESRLAEELVGPLLSERQQPALNGGDAGGGHVAVRRGVLLGVFADVLQHGLQVFQIEQQQPLFVGDFEHDAQDAVLRLVQIQQATEQ